MSTQMRKNAGQLKLLICKHVCNVGVIFFLNIYYFSHYYLEINKKQEPGIQQLGALGSFLPFPGKGKMHPIFMK